MEGWIRRNKSSKLERAYQNLKTELQKLEPPPNLINSCNSAPMKSSPIQEPASDPETPILSSKPMEEASEKSTSDSESAV